jgi:hypothetical protein
MSRVQRIEAELAVLTTAEIAEITRWFDAFQRTERRDQPKLTGVTDRPALLQSMLFNGGDCLVPADEMKRLAYE